MGEDPTAPMETCETCFLRLVTQAVEVGEVSADPLADLQAEFDAARKRRGRNSRAAIQHIADFAGVPEDETRSSLEAVEAHPTATRESLLRLFAEVWLEGR
jgi:hypothetical protein